MIACSLIPMKRTERLGSISSGMPLCRRPMTPWSSSPVRMQMMELVRASVTGILLLGKIGTPRQAGTRLPATSTDSG